MSVKHYRINPDRTLPWNELPRLPIDLMIIRDLDIYEMLGNAKATIGKLQGGSIAIPNQWIFVNTITLQEAKASSEIEHIFTTDDELYKAFSAGEHDFASSASLREYHPLDTMERKFFLRNF